MISVYEFSDYRAFIRAWIDDHASERRGLKSELARKMGVSSSLMSQILSGRKELTPEQATEAAERFGLADDETDFWFLLVEKDRAGTHKLKARLEEKIRAAKQRAKNFANRARKDVELGPEVKSVYYSSWLYSGVRNLTALPGISTVEDVARRLEIPIGLAAKVVQFLVQNGLCRQDGGKLTYGPAYTFAERHSPEAKKHQRNWRLRGLQIMENESDEDLFLSGPMSLSREAAAQVRALLLDTIQEINKKAGPSPSETVACLNVDWFRY